MLKLYFLLLQLTLIISGDVFINSVNLRAQNQDSIFTKEIEADSHRFFLTANDNNFFTGSLEVVDKYNNSVFYADSFYTRYNFDTLIDLNNDGRKELILNLGTGALMYDYNMFLIFDFSENKIEPFEIHNAQLAADAENKPKIVSDVRMSPGYLGTGYSFLLKYDNGKIIPETNANQSRVLANLIPDEKDMLGQMRDYSKEIDECGEESNYQIFFEAYITQMKIAGEEKRGWKFFEKYYNCSNKKAVKNSLKKSVSENYKAIVQENYKFKK
ncbi:MAG: hypothetical protein HGGPFJEG_02808 [Ignavibacteria bacterium]|nr:hypothetical protein [Ignavibacteria bacterium]